MSFAGVENSVHPSGSVEPLALPAVHRIRSDQEAIKTAQQIARRLEVEDSVRDRDRRLPFEEIEVLTRSGLWGITIPKDFGGPGVSHSTLVEVFAILSAADSSLGQIPHSHFCVVDAIRWDGTEAQKRFYFEQVLEGKRFGNAFSEAGAKKVLDFSNPDNSGRTFFQGEREEILFDRSTLRRFHPDWRSQRRKSKGTGHDSTPYAWFVCGGRLGRVRPTYHSQWHRRAGPCSSGRRLDHSSDRHWRKARTHTRHDPVRWKYYAIGAYYLNNIHPPRHPWS